MGNGVSLFLFQLPQAHQGRRKRGGGEVKKFDRSNMKIIVWGIISTVLLLLWGILYSDSFPIIGGITIGILTYLHYKAVKKEANHE